MVAVVTFYAVMLAVHIMAVVVAFGFMFTYPIVVGVGRRIDPRGLPLFHRMQVQVIRRLVNPGLLVVVGVGIYLAAKDKVFDQFFVQWGFIAAVVLGGLGGYLATQQRRLAELAERDVAGGGSLGPEYDTLSHTVSSISLLASLVVLATIFVMTATPGS